MQSRNVMFNYCTMSPYFFILCMIVILHLNVRDNNDSVSANVTLVANTRTHAAFHKAL